MPDQQSSLSFCLQKARELRITEGFGLFILTKLVSIHDYRLVNCAEAGQLKLWLQKKTHSFVCIIDVLDCVLIDSALPFDELHHLFTAYELLEGRQRPSLDLIDFLDELKEAANATTPPIPN